VLKRDAAQRVAVVQQKSINTKNSTGFSGHFYTKIIKIGAILKDIWLNIKAILSNIIYKKSPKKSYLQDKTQKNKKNPFFGGHFYIKNTFSRLFQSKKSHFFNSIILTKITKITSKSTQKSVKKR
jgi:hypothetical protein